jgi:molecular chaperone Hsp33
LTDSGSHEGASSSSPDRIVRALAEDGGLRVVAVTASLTCQDIGRRHRARGAQAVALARAACAGLLLATLTKREEETVTLQILGDGKLGAITVDATSGGRVRAYPRRPDVDIPVSRTERLHLGDLIGTKGTINVVRDVGLREHVSGQTGLVSGEIDQDVEHYLVTSEQIDSVLATDVTVGEAGRISRAAGLLVQAMPDSRFSDLLCQFRDQLSAGRLFTALTEGNARDPVTLTTQALPELAGSLHVLDQRPVFFACPCNRERAENTLALLGKEDIAALLVDPGTAEVVCEFCQTRYHFSAENLEQLIYDFRESPYGVKN